MGKCGAPSMGPFGGGASYFTKGGEVSTGGAHICSLEAGHAGHHETASLMRLSDEMAMRTRYVWADEHELRALVDCVPIKTTVVAI